MVGVGGSVVQILYMQVKRFSLLLTGCQLSCEVFSVQEYYCYVYDEVKFQWKVIVGINI